MIRLYRGDTWEFDYKITDGDDNFISDLEDWEIRAFIYRKEHSIKKANNKVSGGSEDQIKVNDDNKNVYIIFNKNETEECLKGEYCLEIEITSPTSTSSGTKKRYTVVREKVFVIEDLIDWDSL